MKFELTIKGLTKRLTIFMRLWSKERPSPKLQYVIKWLEDNPDKRGLTVRDIATLTGVSKSWVAVAKKYRNETAT